MSFQFYIGMAEPEAAGPPRAATPFQSHAMQSAQLRAQSFAPRKKSSLRVRGRWPGICSIRCFEIVQLSSAERPFGECNLKEK